jgi:hypothetical protein
MLRNMVKCHRIIIIFLISILIGRVLAILTPPNLSLFPVLCMKYLPILTIYDSPIFLDNLEFMADHEKTADIRR